MELRRKLSEWAVERVPPKERAHMNRRRQFIRERFDRVIGFWERQDDLSPEIRDIIREYHNRGQKGAPWTPPQQEPEDNSPLLDPDRLHDLTESLRPFTEEPRAAPQSSKPAGAKGTAGAWKMVPRPAERPSSTMLRGVFVGGPQNGKEMEVADHLCIIVGSVHPTIRSDRGAWLALQDDGSTVAVRGERPKGANWFGYVADIYRQVAKPVDGRVEYAFERTIRVTRCEATTKQGTRCLKEAFEGFTCCGQHSRFGRPLLPDEQSR